MFNIASPRSALSSFFIQEKNEHKVLFALALPMVLSNITVPLLGIVDTAVIGHLPNAYYLGGTSVGNMIITFVIWLCGFLRMSSSGLTAQAYGQQNHQQSLLVLVRGCIVAVAIALCLILLQTPYIELGLSLSGGSEQVQYYARQYSEIRVWGFLPAFINLVVLGWLLGMHQSKVAMWIIIATNLINLTLDLLFVVVLDWKVTGVAYATLASEYSAMLMAFYMVPKVLNLSWQAFWSKIGELKNKIREHLGDFFRLNRDILIRTICLEICFAFMTFQGARLGDTVVASNAILLNFLMLISFGLDGIAYAVEARVGKAKGANEVNKLKLSVSVGLFWTVFFALLYSLMFLAFGDDLIHLITSIEEVLTFAKSYLAWIVALPLLACWCFLFDGVYIGLTQAKTMRNSMLISTFACFFPVWFLLQSFENHGLWAAFCVLMIARGVTLAWHYYRHVDEFIQNT